MRIAVKVNMESGSYWLAEINASDLEGAKAYYMGKYFDMSRDPEGPEKMEKVILVEKLYTVKTNAQRAER